MSGRDVTKYGSMGQPVHNVKGEPWSIVGSGVGTELSVTQAATSGSAWEIGYISAGGSENGFAILKIDGVDKWALPFPATGAVGQDFDMENRGGNFESVELLIVIEASGTMFGNIGGSDAKVKDSRLGVSEHEI